MREVIHTFNSPEYEEKAFMLKVDINKAFDYIDWEFIRGAMEAVGVPV
jgi:hypothetical protein